MDSSSTPEKASPSTSSTSPEAGLGAFIEEVVRKSVTEALKVYRTPPSVAANPKTPSTVSSPAKAHTAGISLSGPYDRPKPKAVSVRDSKVSGSPKKTSSVSHITPISQLKPDNSMCTFEGRAVSKSRLTSYGQHKGALFSVEVIDGSVAEARSLTPGSVVDVQGVVLTCTEVTRVHTLKTDEKKPKRNFSLIDQTGVIQVTAWDEQAVDSKVTPELTSTQPNCGA
ncbi:hypothetical protein FOZ60_006334 [Perkinsus olseni]|uniref:Replication protein A OB domain-containing protein n=1 Tax=Perkinsus olseni TaxID=32597 RepID=A0A7J6NP35_PEROL|nr:hypothetical protein FOZ60_006334 [Perkinsus olseni]